MTVIILGGCLVATLVASMVLFDRTPQATTQTKPVKAIATQTVLVDSENRQSKPESSSDAATAQTDSNMILAVSKLADYPGFGHHYEKDEETFSEEEHQREELIAECMKASGFEYTPAPSVVVDDAVLADEAEFERLLAEAANDPNQAYTQTLSSSMLESYNIALTGLPNPNIEEGLDLAQAQENNSCVSKAFSDVPGVFAKRNSLVEELNRLEIEIQNDQRLTAKTQAWSGCMSAYGFTFARPNEVQNQIDQAVVALMEQGRDQDQGAREAIKLNQAMDQCIKTTSLIETSQQVRTEYENRFADTYLESDN